MAPRKQVASSSLGPGTTGILLASCRSIREKKPCEPPLSPLHQFSFCLPSHSCTQAPNIVIYGPRLGAEYDLLSGSPQPVGQGTGGRQIGQACDTTSMGTSQHASYKASTLTQASGQGRLPRGGDTSAETQGTNRREQSEEVKTEQAEGTGCPSLGDEPICRNRQVP